MGVMLDIAIGLVFVYLILSLLSSAVAEAIEHFYRYRAYYLRQGIEKLLMAGDAKLANAFYSHPLIKSLYSASRWEGTGILAKISRAGGPTYIPTRQFVLTFLDMIVRPNTAPTAAGAGPPAANPTSVADVLAAVQKNAAFPAPVRQALAALIGDAGDDIERLKTNVAEWFDGSMDRVSDWYKRRAQFVLFFIGVGLAIIVNADTLTITQTLSNDAAVRAAIVAAAETYARENPRPDPAAQPPASAGGNGGQATGGAATAAPTDLERDVSAVVGQLAGLGLPVGWRHRTSDDDAVLAALTASERREYLIAQRVWPRWTGRTFAEWRADWSDQLWTHLLGWLLTAFAVSLGAPFWFDLLNKIMVIRSTVKPREKSGEEGSEDRRAPGGAQTIRIEVAPAK